jgi:hypothetical protein
VVDLLDPGAQEVRRAARREFRGAVLAEVGVRGE